MTKKLTRQKETENTLKVRIQRIDKKGRIIINKKIRQEVGMPDNCYVYLSPLGKRKVLLRVIGDAKDLVSLLEKAILSKTADGREKALIETLERAGC